MSNKKGRMSDGASLSETLEPIFIVLSFLCSPFAWLLFGYLVSHSLANFFSFQPVTSLDLSLSFRAILNAKMYLLLTFGIWAGISFGFTSLSRVTLWWLRRPSAGVPVIAAIVGILLGAIVTYRYQICGRGFVGGFFFCTLIVSLFCGAFSAVRDLKLWLTTSASLRKFNQSSQSLLLEFVHGMVSPFHATDDTILESIVPAVVASSSTPDLCLSKLQAVKDFVISGHNSYFEPGHSKAIPMPIDFVLRMSSDIDFRSNLAALQHVDANLPEPIVAAVAASSPTPQMCLAKLQATEQFFVSRRTTFPESRHSEALQMALYFVLRTSLDIDFRSNLAALEHLDAELCCSSGFSWNSYVNLPRLTEQAILFHSEGRAYTIEVTPEVGHWVSEKSRGPAGDSDYGGETHWVIDSPQRIKLIDDSS